MKVAHPPMQRAIAAAKRKNVAGLWPPEENLAFHSALTTPVREISKLTKTRDSLHSAPPLNWLIP